MKKFARKVVRAARRLVLPWRIKEYWHAVRAHELPDTLKPRALYLIGDGTPWCAALLCPCGCRAVLQLSLLEEDSPRWRLLLNGNGLPTLVPSVRRTRGCHSHFFLRGGRIVWSRHLADLQEGGPSNASG